MKDVQCVKHAQAYNTIKKKEKRGGGEKERKKGEKNTNAVSIKQAVNMQRKLYLD